MAADGMAAAGMVAVGTAAVAVGMAAAAATAAVMAAAATELFRRRYEKRSFPVCCVFRRNRPATFSDTSRSRTRRAGSSAKRSFLFRQASGSIRQTIGTVLAIKLPHLRNATVHRRRETIALGEWT
ncbi:hypothetical protein GCM10010985_05320 [Caballeronia grimmiae]|uniref:Secreted protein n=1 Tax=Caballeronia grimmiae TaxID=1071679 RepID=A0ABQ1R2Z4_9BURK|nr:hypothetical protein GCM10010985_05320 [Caballeronia grimmiae]